MYRNGNRRWFCGTVQEYNEADDLWLVKYDDGEEHQESLRGSEQLWQLLDEEPPASAVVAAPPAIMQCEAVLVRLSGGNRLYSSIITAGAAVEAQYGTDEDEGWWPGTVLTAHTEGFHAGSFDVLYADGEAELFKPAKRVRLHAMQRL